MKKNKIKNKKRRWRINERSRRWRNRRGRGIEVKEWMRKRKEERRKWRRR